MDKYRKRYYLVIVLFGLVLLAATGSTIILYQQFKINRLQSDKIAVSKILAENKIDIDSLKTVSVEKSNELTKMKADMTAQFKKDKKSIESANKSKSAKALKTALDSLNEVYRVKINDIESSTNAQVTELSGKIQTLEAAAAKYQTTVEDLQSQLREARRINKLKIGLAIETRSRGEKSNNATADKKVILTDRANRIREIKIGYSLSDDLPATGECKVVITNNGYKNEQVLTDRKTNSKVIINFEPGVMTQGELLIEFQIDHITRVSKSIPLK